MNILDLMYGNTQPGGAVGSVLGNSTLAQLMHSAQTPQNMALSSNSWEPRGQLPATFPDIPQGQIQKPGFFGKGGTGWSILGIIGDALSGAAGHDPIFTQNVMRQREAQQQLQNQKDLLAYKASITGPEKPALQKNYEALIAMGRPDLAESYIRAEANPQTLMTNPATGQLGFYPKGGLPGGIAPSGPPQGAIDMLKQNPSLAPQFDQKYGAGSSTQYLGGAVPSGPQTFR